MCVCIYIYLYIYIHTHICILQQQGTLNGRSVVSRAAISSIITALSEKEGVTASYSTDYPHNKSQNPDKRGTVRCQAMAPSKS